MKKRDMPIWIYLAPWIAGLMLLAVLLERTQAQPPGYIQPHHPAVTTAREAP